MAIFEGLITKRRIHAARLSSTVAPGGYDETTSSGRHRQFCWEDFMRRIALCLTAVLLSVGMPEAAVIEIQALSTSFSPDLVNILHGDTVRWVRIVGIHTTTSGTGSGDPEAGSEWISALDGGTPSFQRQFNIPGSYPYFCEFHEGFGMDGVINVGTRPANMVDVDAVGMVFDPDSVQIDPGDQVRWTRRSESHTTTSGTGSADPNSGLLWDADLNLASPIFTRQFDDEGVFPYYCGPHEFDGMLGVVVVGDPPACDCPNFTDPAANGAVVNVFDVVKAVDVAFRNGTAPQSPDCPVEDTDVTSCDGVTNVFDVVAFVDVAFRNGDPAQFCTPCL
jgi:plastocyanin